MGARTRILSIVALAAAALVPPGAAHAGTSAIIYTAPDGSGTMCSAASPCALVYALGHAGYNTEVVVNPGTYGSEAVPIASGLDDNNHQLNIHGAVGEAPPVIYTSTTYGFDLNSGSSLSDVVVFGTGAYAISDVDDDATFTRVVAENTGDGDTACGVFGSLTDSVCIETGAGGYAVSLSAGSTGPSQYILNVAMRNVTAIATGVGGIGIYDDTGKFTTLTLTATNTIAQGAGYDVEAYSGFASSTSTIVMDHSAYNSVKEDDNGAGGHPTVTPIAQVATPPVYQGSSYREAASSPTVNAGTTAGVASGETDLDGNPRVLGSSTDIGAYEHPQKPIAKKLKAKKLTHTSAHFTVKVNAEGLTTSLQLVATHHGHHVKSKVKSAGEGRHAKKRKVVLHGLKSGTTYHVHAIANNGAGSVKGSAVKIHTKN